MIQTRLRKEFLIENIFIPDEISLVYSMYDRYMVGGAMPVKNKLILETADELKSENFLDRREMGIINVGGDAEIHTGIQEFINWDLRRLYILARVPRDVVFKSADPENPAKTLY